VTAQLVAAQNGSRLWSDTYDENVGDVLKVQGRIAAGLVRALQVTVGADFQSPTTIKNAQAYDLYLRGRHAFDRGSKTALESALGYFQQASELDPSFIRAIEWLASTQVVRAQNNYVPSREGYEQARASVERGLAINPKSGALHSLMALIRGYYDWDWVAAEEEARRALALDPHDAGAAMSAGEVYMALGKWEEAARLYDASLAIDPLNMRAHWNLAVLRIRTGRFSEAEEELRKALESSPTSAELHSDLGWTLLYEGKLEEALAEMQQEPTDLRNWGPALVYHRMGRKAESDTALAMYTKEHADDDPYGIADIHAYRGEVDEAFAWLDRAYRQRQAWLYFVKFNPDFNSLKGDSRFKAFLRKINLPE
jgi:adenylate cyclase